MGEKISGGTTFTTPSDREIGMTLVFNAPRELVFQAHTDPNHIPNWWGPRRMTTTVDMMDVRPGGAWRVVQRDPEGNEYGFRGEYREVVPPSGSSTPLNMKVCPVTSWWKQLRSKSTTARRRSR